MNCKRHPDRAAVAQCELCNMGICNECVDRTSASGHTICVSCYERELSKYRSEFKTDIERSKRSAIIMLVFYVTGIVLLILNFALMGGSSYFLVFELLCCGLSTAIIGWKDASGIHSDYENKNGASYAVTDSGVYRDRGTGMKIIFFRIGLILGVIITPIRNSEKV